MEIFFYSEYSFRLLCSYALSPAAVPVINNIVCITRWLCTIISSIAMTLRHHSSKSLVMIGQRDWIGEIASRQYQWPWLLILFSEKIKAQFIRDKAIISSAEVREPLRICSSATSSSSSHTHRHIVLLICNQELESVKQCNRLRFRWQKEFYYFLTTVAGYN